ncbi:MAG: hypothetical protein J5862_04765 [Bacteroidales bacterium]|nr:hypothetical protein [Bacteroidales bacterium]
MLGGGGGTADWYFYNQQLIRSGRQQFQQKWGNRKLEDNWRLIAKNFSTSFQDGQLQGEGEDMAEDSTSTTVHQLLTDPHDPQYYHQHIPKTEEDIAKSDSLIATALYNMFFIYRDQIEDENMASKTFEEFQKRFPEDKRLLNLYYSEYIHSIKKQDHASQIKYRSIILEKYPDSDEAKIVSQPDYFERAQKMAMEQDSVYALTYYEFTHNDFNGVKKHKQYAEENYPLSELMPKFLFLNSIAVAKTEGQDAFVGELKNIVDKYGQSDVASMAKDMLALLNVGEESKQDGELNSLADKRAETEMSVDSALIDKTFSEDKAQTTFIYYICAADEQIVNQLLYEIALFNFSQFLIKDFDLKKENPLHFKEKYDTFNQTEKQEYAAIEILKFDNYDDAQWYADLLAENAALKSLFEKNNVSTLIISEENESLIRAKFTLEEYRDFEKNVLLK